MDEPFVDHELGFSPLEKLKSFVWQLNKQAVVALKWLDLEEELGRARFSDQELLAGNHLRWAFAGLPILQKRPDFVDVVLKRMREIYCRHAVLVLGHTGHGKSTVCNNLRHPEGNPANRARTGRGTAITTGAKAYELPSSLDDLEVRPNVRRTSLFLVDTEGWKYNTFSKTAEAYKLICTHEGLDKGHHVPVILLVMSSAKEMDSEVKHMRDTFKQFTRTKLPVTVIPVVTWADTLKNDEERRDAELQAERATRAAFPGSGVVVKNAHLVSEALDSRQRSGFLELLRTIERTIKEQVQNPAFRELWLRAMAEGLETTCQQYLAEFHDQESPLGLFKAAHQATCMASRKRCALVSGSQGRPPWWVLPQIPLGGRPSRMLLKKATRGLCPRRWGCMESLLMFVVVLLLRVMYVQHVKIPQVEASVRNLKHVKIPQVEASVRNLTLAEGRVGASIEQRTEDNITSLLQRVEHSVGMAQKADNDIADLRGRMGSIEVVEQLAGVVPVYVFDNQAYLAEDTTHVTNDGANALADLASLGLPYRTFSSVDSSIEWAPVATRIMVPSLGYNSPLTLSDDVAGVLRRWVSAGGHLVSLGAPRNGEFLNAVFGWSLNVLEDSGDTIMTSDLDRVTCSVLCGGPDFIAQSITSSSPATLDSLPNGSRAEYSYTQGWVSAFTHRQGKGMVIYLGFAWTEPSSDLRALLSVALSALAVHY